MENNKTMIKILIADDHQLFTDLISYKLSNYPEIDIVGCANDGISALKMVDELKPDILLLDIIMPKCGGIEVIKKLRTDKINIKILVLTSSDYKNDIHEALKHGANGYVSKNINGNDLILAIKSVIANLEVFHKEPGDYNNIRFPKKNIRYAGRMVLSVDGNDVILSERELLIIKFLSDGLDIERIANKLFLSEGRVRNIITSIISKLNLKDKTQIVVYALKNSLI